MARQKLLTIEDVLKLVPDNGNGQTDGRVLVRRAYEFAAQAHEGQGRDSGEPFIQHPLSVAHFLSTLKLDPQTIAAGLLHDVAEDCPELCNISRITEEFGPEIGALVDGVTKLDRINKLSSNAQDQRKDQESESLRKTFLAMGKDVRVMLIKLADRMDNMHTLDALSVERQRRIARETLEIFAPLADRLGFWQWKWELEDLGFRYLHEDEYQEIATLINERRALREQGILEHIEILRQRLKFEGIEADISGRPKHIYSIWRKMRRKDVPFNQVYDVRGIRVLVNSVADCYRVLGIVHGLWRPVPGEFDDYIATPKDNAYQSLHTAVLGEDGRTLEIQIRTWEMHQIAEYGIAAHWRYKDGVRQDPVFEQKLAWLRAQTEWSSEVADAQEFVDSMKADLFADRVYTFTPKGKLIDLPAGATPIDFAYQVHTEIGHRCRGAKVNGRWVPLTYQLQTGEQVEIITTKRAAPSRDWLNPSLGFVRSTRARAKIRQWFRRQDREKNIALGREIVDRELRRLGVEHLSQDAIAQLFGYDSVDDFLAAVGFGDINSPQIASKVFGAQLHKDDKGQDEADDFDMVGDDDFEGSESASRAAAAASSVAGGIQVRGTGGLLTRLAQCCHPIPDEPIVGYVTRGRGVTVHRRDCPNILRTNETERLIEVEWGPVPETFPVPIRILAYDRPRLLHEITGVIAKENVNLSGLNANRRRNITTFYLTLEIARISQLSQVMTKIGRLSNVIEVERYIA